jgi:hypothetical protein
MKMPTHIPLTGADFFALLLDYDLRRAGMPGNICRLMAVLDGTVKAEQIKAILHNPGLMTWLADIRLTRRFPFAQPYWSHKKIGGAIPIIEGNGHDGFAALQQSGATWLADAPDISLEKTPPLALHLGRETNGNSVISLIWHHALMDARGAEALLRHLDSESGAGAHSSPPVDVHHEGARGPRSWLQFADRSRFARKSLFTIDDVSRSPIASFIQGEHNNLGHRILYKVIRFGEEETECIDRNCDLVGAGFRRSLFYLAAAVRALDAIRAHRALEPMAYVIPTPQDLRKRGRTGPALGNRFSFLYYRIEPGEAASIRKAVASLIRQMTAQVRNEIPQSFAAAMDISRSFPLGFYSYLLRRPSHGKIGSFIFSDTGHNLKGLSTFAGAPVSAVYHLAPPSFPPGIAVVSGRFQKKFYMVLSWIEGCLDPGEQNMFGSELRSQLLAEDSK